jgi:hypothetical protein
LSAVIEDLFGLGYRQVLATHVESGFSLLIMHCALRPGCCRCCCDLAWEGRADRS